MKEDREPEKNVGEVLKGKTKELISVPGVVGTAEGLCDGKPCIKVYVIKKTPALEKKVISVLDGFPVAIEETGEIRPLQ